MTLSQSVQTNLKEARETLKNALSCAVNQDDTCVLVPISGIIQDIDEIMKCADE
jgi:hypothetical protein